MHARIAVTHSSCLEFPASGICFAASSFSVSSRTVKEKMFMSLSSLLAEIGLEGILLPPHDVRILKARGIPTLHPPGLSRSDSATDYVRPVGFSPLRGLFPCEPSNTARGVNLLT